MFKLDIIVRPNIRDLIPYKSARDDFYGEAEIWLDANENPFDTGLNRYPDPYQRKLKTALAQVKEISEENIFIGNGSDEIIDILMRTFCIPGKDRILVFTPTYGIYKVVAGINDVDVLELPLNENLQLPMLRIREHFSDRKLKLIFVCSPNNPTGNLMKVENIITLCLLFKGIVVVDEAYIDFSDQDSLISQMRDLPNLVVLQTLSKAWGLAGIRLGIGYMNPEIITLLNKVKPPYNISTLNQNTAIEKLQHYADHEKKVQAIRRERDKMQKKLEQLTLVKKVYTSEANFLLVEVAEPKKIFEYFLNQGIVVRDRTSAIKDCLRFTIGTKKENEKLIEVLEEYARLNNR